MRELFTFDDVLLAPKYSEVVPADTDPTTYLSGSIRMPLPFLSSPMDTVTEHKMAISIALQGGIGVIHKNMSIEAQVAEIEMVKRFENGFIEDPIVVHPENKIQTVLDVKKEKGFKKFPVVDKKGVLVGFISDIDYFAATDRDLTVKFRMQSRESLIVATSGVTLEEANDMIREHRLKTLCVVDDTGVLVSIVTRRDIEKNEEFPNACKNDAKQLRVGAATSVGEAGFARAEALINAGVDLLVVDTAHGHSKGVIDTVKKIKLTYPNQVVVAGNIATADAAKALIKAGADVLKVGIGPGSICTTRVVAGIGVPQLSAIMDVVEVAKKEKGRVRVIADGGIRSSGDIVKALAAGADAVMMGNMFSGTDESPGEIEFVDGRMYKQYRGMGSLEAMQMGSKDRYGQADVKEKKKFVPEGVSAKTGYKGPVQRIVYQLAGGLRSGMGYNGAKDLTSLQKKAEFIKITQASLGESHPHDLGAMDDAPNYSK